MTNIQDLVNEYEVDTPVSASVIEDIEVPTLISSATIVSLSRHVPSFKRDDKTAARRAAESMGAKRGRYTSNKKLIVCDEHDALLKQSNTVYRFVRDRTMRWGELGQQLLPNEAYTDFDTQVQEMVQEFYVDYKPAFLRAYPAACARSQLSLGEGYDPRLYPSVHELEGKIQIYLDYEPLPKAGDFRIDLPRQAQELMKKKYQQLNQRRLQESMEDIWKRLLKPLKNMSAKLDYDDEGKPRNGHFQTTIVDNVIQIVDLMKICNLANDPQMDRVQRDLRNALTGVTPEMLKVSDTQRRKTKAEVDSIIKSLPNFGF
tara:strand:- start:934 stop:1881 length:948 start_codon:yes stop_codon:yes gene_type:complete